MKVLLTGASGCIGTAVSEAARARGHEVVGLARHAAPGVAVVADVTDASAVAGAVRGCDAVVHLAGWAHRIPSGEGEVAELRHSVVDGTRAVARAARQIGAKLIFASTVAVYGSAPAAACDETHRPAPDTPYGAAKLDAEAALAEIDPTASIFRLALVYGPRDRGNVRSLIEHVEQGRGVVVGGGRNRKSLAYVDNVADRVVLALEHGPERGERGGAGGTWIVADEAPTQADLLGAIAKAVGRPPPRRIPMTVALAAATLLDPLRGRLRAQVRKLASATEFTGRALDRRLDYTPRVSLAEGLARTVAWQRARAVA